LRRFLVLPLLLLPACQLVDLELSITDQCHSWPGATLPGAPVDGKLTHTFTLEKLPEAEELSSLDAHVEELTVDIHAATGTTDLSFVDHISVHAGDLVLLDCDRSCVTADGALRLQPTVPDELLAIAARGELQLTLELTASSPPPANWTVNIDACLTASARFNP
jgi:hypothetical protein